MHRPSWVRALLAVWGLWFATALTEPAGILACAMHGVMPAGGATRGAEGTSVAAVAGGHDGGRVAHRTHGMHGAHGAPRSPAPADPAHGGCTCLGSCCSVAPASVPRSPEVETAEVAVTAPVPIAFTRECAVPPRAHVLPFANAPPATSRT